MPKAYTEHLQKGDTPVGTNVDIIASGYETTCPRCKALCILIEVPYEGEGVTCPECGSIFTTGLPEHAYG
ncbi:hypothetical protein LCGC14_2655630 [marine sediment metagenome]|uniref:Uncharacterized protein n=1 Tax=marine sediment metagenome TaxID=412755 RepID=A0A0F8ZTL2_9ZZZZ